MKKFVEDRWFPVIDLLFTVSAAFLWFLGAGYLTWEPLVIALFPWGMRASAGRFPFRRTSLDGWLLLFLVTAVVSIYFAYDPQLAMSKLWILVGAVLLFYSLAAQSRRDIWLMAIILGALSAVVIVYFLLTNDWRALPADIGLINWFGVRWMQIRPSLPLPLLHPNSAGGVIAITLPFQLALYLYGRRAKHHTYQQLALLFGAISLGGLFLTSSRAAWVSLAVGLAVWWGWGQSHHLAQRQKMQQMTLFVGIVVALIVAFLLAIQLFPQSLQVVNDALPGNNTAFSRAMLAQSTIDLIGDYPFFGAGLANFGGLYSQYIAVTPVFIFNYGHQFFLDVIFEQGILGLATLLVIHTIAGWLLLRGVGKELYMRVGLERRNGRHKNNKKAQKLHLDLFRWAIAAAGVTVTLHSLIDDPLYGYLATPFLFLLPGLVIMVSERRDAPPVLHLKDWPRPIVLVPMGVLLVGGVVAGIVWQRPLHARWLAMNGAVQMAKIELQNWPTNQWDDGSQVELLEPAAITLQNALALNPTDRTANHRLGLIAMLKRDYNSAANHLEIARQQDPSHLGINKALGYSYLWQGDYNNALVFLTHFPEVSYELANYVNWWRRNGRDDLAQHAAEMSARLEAQPDHAQGNAAP
ncbi:MAG: hypothetical protein Kow0080_02510 [Candidatus Promineifilaceae bacterium]